MATYGEKRMKLLIKDRTESRYTVFACCENCRKLIRKYSYDTDRGGIKRSETGRIVDDIKRKMVKADLNYCYHCGERTIKGDD